MEYEYKSCNEHEPLEIGKMMINCVECSKRMLALGLQSMSGMEPSKGLIDSMFGSVEMLRGILKEDKNYKGLITETKESIIKKSKSGNKKT